MSSSQRNRFVVPLKFSQCSSQNSDGDAMRGDILSGLSQRGSVNEDRNHRNKAKYRSFRVDPAHTPLHAVSLPKEKRAHSPKVAADCPGEIPTNLDSFMVVEDDDVVEMTLDVPSMKTSDTRGDRNSYGAKLERRIGNEGPTYSKSIVEQKTLTRPVGKSLNVSTIAPIEKNIYDFDLSPKTHQKYLALKRKKTAKSINNHQQINAIQSQDLTRFKLLKLIENTSLEMDELWERRRMVTGNRNLGAPLRHYAKLKYSLPD